MVVQVHRRLRITQHCRTYLLLAHAGVDEVSVILEVLEGQQRHGSVLVVDGGDAVMTARGLLITASHHSHRVVLPFLVWHD